jgi:hypothetical protein
MTRSLPHCEIAIIEDSKLTAYALNPDNERGKHKARVFARVLVYDQSNWEKLKLAILGALPRHEAMQISETVFGVKYQVILSIVGANGRVADVMTVWQYDRLANGLVQDAPRLVTLYVLW